MTDFDGITSFLYFTPQINSKYFFTQLNKYIQ